MLGPVIVWGPYVAIEIIRGNISHVIILIVLGVILFFIDSILKSKIIGDKAKLHPVIILIGIFGGIQFMGIVGIVAGPIIRAKDLLGQLAQQRKANSTQIWHDIKLISFGFFELKFAFPEKASFTKVAKLSAIAIF